MAYSNYLEKKKDRDTRLYQHHLVHPKMTQRVLANIFKISQARVSIILRSETAMRETKEQRGQRTCYSGKGW